MGHNPARGRAATFLARVNLAIIKAAASRRQGHKIRAPGARPPAGLAATPVIGRALNEPRPGGKAEPITPLGYKTATRGLPRILGALEATDPRLMAAKCLTDTVERLATPGGPRLEGSAPKSIQSDGGATTRVKLAARHRLIEALANGWQIERNGAIKVGVPRVALTVGRQTGGLKEIRAFEALLAMCVDGQSADEILRRHGWTPKSKARARLRDALLDALDDVADGLGFGRWDRKNP